MTDESGIGRFIQPDKIYHGWRMSLPLMIGITFPGGGFPFVTVNGRPLRAFNFDSVDHFEWGYNGLAPRMLALAILADYFGETPTSQDYKSLQGIGSSSLNCIRYFGRFLNVIINLQRDASWTVSSDHIREWLAVHQAEATN